MRPLLISLAAVILPACGEGGFRAPGTMTTAQEAEIEAVVREYLLREPEILFEMQRAYQAKEEMKQSLQAEKAWDQLIKSSQNDPMIGNKDAPITIIEFSDYECTFCKRAMPWVLAQADDSRQDIRVIVKESAWKEQTSEPAARAALAARKQGKYREMHIALMKAPYGAFTPEFLEAMARSAGLDIPRWKSDMISPEITKQIGKYDEEYKLAGVSGTPSFLINGVFVGGFDQAQLESVIEAQRQTLRARR